MNNNQRLPRTSALRILSFLFAASVAFSCGIYVHKTFAPSSDQPTLIFVTDSDAATSGMDDLDRIITAAGSRHGVDPQLIHAVIWKESNYRRTALSPRGAQGLMQLTQDTARRFGCRNAGDPTANVEAGTRYLRKLLERFDGDVRLALAGYNAGEGSVDKHNGIPPYPETRNFVRQIVTRYGRTHHPLA